MLQHSLTYAVCIKFRADTRLNVIIHFNIANAIFIYHPVNHFIYMLKHCGITEVKLISASVKHSFPVAHKKPVIRCLLCLFTIDSHYLKFKPYSGNHPFRADVISYLLHSSGKTFSAFLPFSYTVPPFSGCIPAGINYIIFTPHFSCCINQWNFFFRGRITKQAVHIIIKNNRKLLIVLIISSNSSPVGCQLPHRSVKISFRYTHCHRNRSKGLSRF